MPTAPSRPWPERTLPILLLLCFGICLVIALFSLPYLRDMLVRERGNDLARTAAVVADTLDRILFERLGDILVMSQSAVLQEGAADEKRQKLERYKDIYGYYSWLAVTDADGRIVTQTPTLALSQVADQDWFREPRRTQSIYLLDAAPSPDTGAHMAVGFSAPIYGPKGTFLGVVTTRMPVEKLRSLIDREGSLRYREGERYDWLLLDRKGTVISEAQQDGTRYLGEELDSVRAADRLPGRPGFLEEMHRRRAIPVLTGYAKTHGYGSFPGFNWTVLVRIDRDQAHAPVNEFIWTVGLIAALIVAPLGGFAVWASWQLVREGKVLRRTQEELRESVTELTRSNQDLQQFAYVASHDLQEPLRMVASYTQLLARRYKGKLDSDADEFIGFAVEGAKRMQQLITDLLAYSRVSTQARTAEPVDCAAILQQVLSNLRLAIEESKAVITVGPLPTVTADGTQLTQLLQNLISNAIKFHGPSAPTVHVSAERRAGEWLFSVRDNGIGIDSQYADRIFVIFQRLHTRQDYPGTGIGLAMCKKIMERHGGRIWVTSQLGQGATFYFTLPISHG